MARYKEILHYILHYGVRIISHPKSLLVMKFKLDQLTRSLMRYIFSFHFTSYLFLFKKKKKKEIKQAGKEREMVGENSGIK